ncbi:MAG: acetate--CoA ligase family protein [Clostridia bacterium]
MSTFLNELDANKLLSSFDIPMAKSFCCKVAEEALLVAEELKFPVVMKILSPDIQHKTEAGCVFIGISSKEQVEKTFELIMKNAKAYNPDAVIDGVLIQEMAEKGLEIIVGMKKDPQFGPVIMAGSGGIYVEVFKDIALRLLPIDRYEAERMLAETKAYQIINGARGKTYDIDKLIDVLLNVSRLIQENDSIEEIDINPFFIYEKGKGGKGVDALIKIR